MPRLPVIPFIVALVIGGAAFAQTEEAPMTFKDIQCVTDCSEERSGYDWAIESRIQAIEDCIGQSHSFNEGCMAWAREQTLNEGNSALFEFDDASDNIVE